MQTRRHLLQLGITSGLAPALSTSLAQTAMPFLDIVRVPDYLTVYTEHGALRPGASGTHWKAERVQVTTEPSHTSNAMELRILLAAPGTSVTRIHLRWRGTIGENWRFLGDAWERSYGDLEWRVLDGERVMPWYFLMSDGEITHCYGVKTGPAAFCFWQVDTSGISLWLDVRNGSEGLRLTERDLQTAVVIASRGELGVSAFREATAFCRRLCEHPRLPTGPLYGSNNWYYTYGEGFGASDILRDSELISELSPANHEQRPYMVIDMGWGAARDGARPWNKASRLFPDMPGLAGKMKDSGVKPGLWVRPLLTREDIPASWRMPSNRLTKQLQSSFAVIDPSVPEALARLQESLRQVIGWGFQMIKHDFSTYDILGRWGFQMGGELTSPGWHFADRTKTTAEIIRMFYRSIRDAAGQAVLIGCNTIGHLSAGLFEIQRIGDDTSGKDWNRTRKMGVNTLAFRLPQHRTFFAADPDCVPITGQVSWNMTRQWLDLVARSGTALFVSADPTVTGATEKSAIRKAFTRVLEPNSAEPLDWKDTVTPADWSFKQGHGNYDWFGESGASPFSK
jgi:alpha-galactosidase